MNPQCVCTCATPSSFREVRGLSQRVNARGTSLWGNQPDRRWSVGEVPLKGRGTDDFDGCRRHLVLREKIANLLCSLWRELVDVPVKRKKTICKPQVVNPANRLLWSVVRTDQQPQRHRLKRPRRCDSKRNNRMKPFHNDGSSGRAQKRTPVHGASFLCETGNWKSVYQHRLPNLSCSPAVLQEAASPHLK